MTDSGAGARRMPELCADHKGESDGSLAVQGSRGIRFDQFTVRVSLMS